MEERFLIRAAARSDVPELLRLIGELAVYEKLADQAKGTPAALEAALFGPRPACEALVAEVGGPALCFALFFTSFSTFLCKPDLYLDDVFVESAHRGGGIGTALLSLFFFKDTAPTEIYTLSLHDALPISSPASARRSPRRRRRPARPHQGTPARSHRSPHRTRASPAGSPTSPERPRRRR